MFTMKIIGLKGRIIKRAEAINLDRLRPRVDSLADGTNLGVNCNSSFTLLI